MKTKLLIINVDDFGSSPNANIAISELLENHHISSASIMVNGAFYHEALDIIRDKHFDNIGVHLTVTNDNFEVENPVLLRSVLHQNSLEDKEGHLARGTEEFRKRYRSHDLLEEVIAQFKQCLSDGIDFTHIDNHMYSIFPGLGFEGYQILFEAVKRLHDKKKRGVRIARKCLDVDGLFSIWAGRKLRPFLWYEMKKNRLVGPDYSYLFSYEARKMPSMEEKVLHFERFLQNLQPGITEIHFHPCIYTEDFELINPTWCHRVQEFELLKTVDPIILQKKYSVTLTSYKELIKNY